MKQINFRSWIMVLAIVAGLGATSCKSKTTETTTTTTTTTDTNNANYTTPVEVTPDAALTKGVQDAVKDYPGVTATVNNGEVTLTGTVVRDRLAKLMQSIQALSPKKVNNELKIK